MLKGYEAQRVMQRRYGLEAYALKEEGKCVVSSGDGKSVGEGGTWEEALASVKEINPPRPSRSFQVDEGKRARGRRIAVRLPK